MRRWKIVLIILLFAISFIAIELSILGFSWASIVVYACIAIMMTITATMILGKIKDTNLSSGESSNT